MNLILNQNDNNELIKNPIERDYKCVIFLDTVIKNCRGKESLALSKKVPKCTLKWRFWKKKSMSTFKLQKYTTEIFKENETVTKKLT